MMDTVAAVSERPVQAVILAGGRGTRLAPLTDALPKPMVHFHGRPFLEYLIALLRGQGIDRILLLTGYRGEVIEQHFGNGDAFGVHIVYDRQPEAFDTGARLAAARALIDPRFLLMYADNYWPLPLAALQQSWGAAGTQAQVVVYRNADRYTRSNLRVDDDRRVAIYDKSRKSDGLQGVDIGFMLLERDAVLDRLPSGNPSFEATVFPHLVADRQLAAFVSDHRYYSVGDLERLTITETFLERRPTLLLDRDGVLNRRMPPAEYVRSWHDWQWEDGVLPALSQLTAAGWRLIVITNQPGIARGMLTQLDLDAIHHRMRMEVAEAGGHIDAVYYCPHGWNDGCTCRKPAPGLLYRAQRDFHLDLSRTPFAGDDERDGLAASAAGAPFAAITPDFPLSALANKLIGSTP